MKIDKIGAGAILLITILFLPGCDFIGGKNFETIMNSVQRFIGGNRNAINQAEDTKNIIENLNPVFQSEEETKVSDSVAKQVDELFKKSLGTVFSDSKLVSIQNEGKTPFIMKYVVKRRIDQADNEALYNDLIKSGCRAKTDSNPSFNQARNSAEFSVYHDFGGRSYILAVVLDISDQSIWVNVY